jgi:hypothetical protein
MNDPFENFKIRILQESSVQKNEQSKRLMNVESLISDLESLLARLKQLSNKRNYHPEQSCIEIGILGNVAHRTLPPFSQAQQFSHTVPPMVKTLEPSPKQPFDVYCS